MEDQKLRTIVDLGNDAIKGEVNRTPSLTSDLSQQVNSAKRSLDDIYTRYIIDLHQMRDHTVSRLSNESYGFLGQKGVFPTDSHKLEIHNTGYLDPKVSVEVKYSGVSRTGWLGFRRKTEQAKLSVSLYDPDLNKKAMPDLYFYVDKNSKLNDNDSKRIAEYLKGVVSSALSLDFKFAEKGIPELNEIFEESLVMDIAVLFNDPSIVSHYLNIRQGENLSEQLKKIAEQYEETIAGAKGNAENDFKRLSQNLSRLEEAVKVESEKVRLTVLSHTDVQKQRITDQANLTLESLTQYEEKRRTQLDGNLDREYQGKIVELNRQVVEYQGQLERAKSELKRIQDASGNFSKNIGECAYFNTQLNNLFPNYDKKGGDSEDVTPLVKAKYASRIAGIKTRVSKENLMDMLGALTTKLRPSGIRCTNSDIGSMIGLVETYSSLIDDSFFVNCGYRNSFANRITHIPKNSSIEELKDFLDLMFGQKKD
jgi:hypothetical protein